MKARNFAGAVAIAILIALPFVQPTLWRVDTWKIVLGVAGVVMFLRAGMTKG